VSHTTKFGEQLTRVMDAAGHKIQDSLAGTIDVCQGTISKLKSGKMRPSAELVDKIAKPVASVPGRSSGEPSSRRTTPGIPS
jgi:DNA-binding XRE family transcriptional regulator